MPRSPEAKIHIFGRDIDPKDVGTGGLFLTMAGIWAGNYPCLALPAILVGVGALAYGTYKMGREGKKG